MPKANWGFHSAAGRMGSTVCNRGSLVSSVTKGAPPQLSIALQELNLVVQRYQVFPPSEESTPAPSEDSNLKDLLNMLYFGALFDVKSQSDFTATMLMRTPKRGCCLTYDYVTNDATDLLGWTRF
ncbi:hypothetical protein CDL15_Pgr016744 [Punica granatum]|uniref:Uncharacterized protein n=1 Tax=Punica granatum TaxID=22663 RepID=A0A218WX25_PUNGR|nr:hypothetical protein CDL15_Pgr016744 [Punica granatum]